MAETNMTKLAQLIDPEVMADVISATLPKKIRVAPIARLDTTLAGVPGDTITVPSYGYIGDAALRAEGDEIAIAQMSETSKTAVIKDAAKGVLLTDRAVLCGYGNPVGEANAQLALAIAAKVDNDCMDALQTASLSYDGSAANISYDGIVDAIDLFEEEVNSEKVLFVHPKQVTQLRKDADFISADKYQAGVAVTGEIGMIANTHIVPSKKVPVVQVGASGSAVDCYACPLVKLDGDPETDGALPALTIFLKRDTNVETERKPGIRSTAITADRLYVAALTNESKVVLAKFKK